MSGQMKGMKVILEKKLGADTYKVKKLVNRVEPTIGSHLKEQHVKDLINEPLVKVEIVQS
jgi:hypothetical protein